MPVSSATSQRTTLELEPNRARPFTLQLERAIGGTYLDIWVYTIKRGQCCTVVRVSSRFKHCTLRHWVERYHELVIEHGPMSIDSTRINITEQDATRIAKTFGLEIEVRQ